MVDVRIRDSFLAGVFSLLLYFFVAGDVAIISKVGNLEPPTIDRQYSERIYYKEDVDRYQIEIKEYREKVEDWRRENKFDYFMLGYKERRKDLVYFSWLPWAFLGYLYASRGQRKGFIYLALFPGILWSLELIMFEEIVFSMMSFLVVNFIIRWRKNKEAA